MQKKRKSYYDELDKNKEVVFEVLTNEKNKFNRTLEKGLKEFEKIKADGDEVICLTLSSALSGTYQSAVIAKAMADYDGIYIVDTLGVTHMIGILAKFAKEQAAVGVSAPEIVRQCEELNKAAACGMSIFDYNPKCNGAEDYMALAKEINKGTKDKDMPF